MQVSVVVRLLACSLWLGACAVGPTTAIATLPPPIREAVMVNVGPGEVRITAVSGQAVQGQRYHFEALTHCGLRANTFDFDGSFWTVAGGGGDDGNGNPPQGIGNPVDAGVIQLIGPNAAVWTSALGIRINLERTAVETQTFLCD